ncbi:putative DNA ligase (ATP) [Rosa chinensis]|uniref:Putative DNA ligase (ATP) n=1 Tax=Rosa chinensis TaxID=74649 RepID=A0A2P6RGW5_ROSCH|nr:putative DNA ligase (ATP) [Rosa chinensis]
MANKKEFLRGFHRGTTEGGGKVHTDAKDYTMEGQDQEKKATPSDIDTMGDTNVGFGKELYSPLQEPDSQTPILLTDEKAEEIIQQLRNCLPSWVTRQQMLDLIGSSGGDIVEAVTKFYDVKQNFMIKELPLQVPYLYSRPAHSVTQHHRQKQVLFMQILMFLQAKLIFHPTQEKGGRSVTKLTRK